MPFQIQEAVAHAIKKAMNTSVATVKHRTKCFRNDDPILIAFTDELLKTFSTEANTWGEIEKPDENIFHQKLINWQSAEDEDTHISFHSFSKATVKEIKKNIEQSYKATGGYILFINYLKDNKIFLLIVMLKLETTYGIDEENLNFYESQSFSMKNFHEAARLNLSTWLTRNDEDTYDEEGQPDRYLSFVKKRGEDQDITRYFRKSLGCKNFAESLVNTVNLIESVNDYMESKGLDPHVMIEKRAQLHSYLANKIQTKEPASLRDVTGLLSPTDEDTEENELLTFIREGGYKIDETFKPNPRKVKALDRVSGKIGKTSLNFPVDELDKSVFYDSKSRTITLYNVPDDLDEKIKQAKGS